MKITEVRIFPTRSKDERLKAYATMTFDDWFVVRNVKVIQGNSGLFVAMPSRKMMDPCKKCGSKNVRGSRFCNECGSKLERVEAPAEPGRKRQGEHVDIAHPIRQECRVYIQDKVLEAYNAEMKRKEQEGDAYRPATESDLDEASKSLAGEAKHRGERNREEQNREERDRGERDRGERERERTKFGHEVEKTEENTDIEL